MKNSSRKKSTRIELIKQKPLKDKDDDGGDTTVSAEKTDTLSTTNKENLKKYLPILLNQINPIFLYKNYNQRRVLYEYVYDEL